MTPKMRLVPQTNKALHWKPLEGDRRAQGHLMRERERERERRVEEREEQARRENEKRIRKAKQIKDRILITITGQSSVLVMEDVHWRKDPIIYK